MYSHTYRFHMASCQRTHTGWASQGLGHQRTGPVWSLDIASLLQNNWQRLSTIQAWFGIDFARENLISAMCAQTTEGIQMLWFYYFTRLSGGPALNIWGHTSNLGTSVSAMWPILESIRHNRRWIGTSLGTTSWEFILRSSQSWIRIFHLWGETLLNSCASLPRSWSAWAKKRLRITCMLLLCILQCQKMWRNRIRCIGRSVWAGGDMTPESCWSTWCRSQREMCVYFTKSV